MPKIKARERLPAHQKTIETGALTHFRQNLTMVAISKPLTGYAMLGIIIGEEGVSKTIGCIAFAEDFEDGCCIYFKTPPRPTPDKVLMALLEALGGKFDPESGKPLSEQVLDLIEVLNVQLIIADEGNWLDTECFETIRYIHDEAQVSIVIVGSPQLTNVVKKKKKFRSRVGLVDKFSTLKKKEFLKIVLPNLMMPHWKFDPTDQQDLRMGLYLWQHVKASFQELRQLLQAASVRAYAFNIEWINQKVIEDTIQMINKGLLAEKTTSKNVDNKDEKDDEDDEEMGELELEAEQRSAALAAKAGK